MLRVEIKIWRCFKICQFHIPINSYAVYFYISTVYMCLIFNSSVTSVLYLYPNKKTLKLAFAEFHFSYSECDFFKNAHKFRF